MARTRRSRLLTAQSEAWKAFYATPHGKTALAALFAEFHVYAPVNSRDPIEIAIATGERNVALRIAQLVALKPEQFIETAGEDLDIIDRLITQSRT
jgi:hypothetical protein